MILQFLEVFIRQDIKLVEQPHKIPIHQPIRQVVMFSLLQMFPTEQHTQQGRVDRFQVSKVIFLVNQVKVVTWVVRTHTQVKALTQHSKDKVHPITGVPISSLPRTNDELSNLSFIIFSFQNLNKYN